MARQKRFLYTCDAKLYHRQKGKFYSYDKPMLTQTCHPTLTFTSPMITALSLLSQSAWRNSFHKKPSRRSKEWFLSSSTGHYQCWCLWVKKTQATSISGMVFFKHKYISNPTVSPEYTILAVAQDMPSALRRNMPTQLGEDTLTALKKLHDIFTLAAVTNKEE